MFDSLSVIKDIHIGKNVITIWHNDPCTDGTDDSCGRFMRPRHCDQEKLLKVEKEFDYSLNHQEYFYSSGAMKFSVSGIVLNLYKTALWVHFEGDRLKVDRFLRKNLHKILFFAENPVDCLGDTIENKYGADGRDRKAALDGLANIIYSDICRMDRPWWKNPKWHFHHWKITISFFKRRCKNKPSPRITK